MPIVLVPGFMLDRDLWSDVEAPLRPFGPLIHSDPTQGASFPEMAEATLRNAPDRFDLIGFSMGGYIAREMVRQAPERVMRLVLIATSSRGDGDIQASRKAIAATAETFRGIGRPAIRKSLSPEREKDADLVERIRQMSVRLGADTFRRQASIGRSGDTDQLGQIPCPTLIVAGSRDRLRSIDEAEELARGIPDAQMITFDTGHMIPLEAPSALAAAIVKFLGPSNF